MIITHEKIVQDYKGGKQVSVFSVFALLGLIVPFIPFFVLKTFDLNSIMSFGFLMAVFGIPFGIFIGLKNIIYVTNVNCSIRNNKIFIIEDVIEDMRMSPYHIREDDDSKYGQITLEKFSNKSNKVLYITSKEFKTHSEGEKCILVFSQYNKKYPALRYIGNDYQIDNTLQQKIK